MKWRGELIPESVIGPEFATKKGQKTAVILPADILIEVLE